MSSTEISSCIALITARGGSKGIPRKNLMPLCGVPLLAHSIRAARQAGIFSSVIVSSDCKEILDLAASEDATPLERPANISGDSSRSEDAIRHALLTLGYEPSTETNDVAMLLQPTSPLRNASHIRSALEHFSTQPFASLISVVEWEHPPQKSLIIDDHGKGQPLISWQSLTLPRQALAKAFRPNGAIYLFRIAEFLRTDFLFAQPMGLLVMDTASSIDIDSPQDVIAAERILGSRSDNDCSV
jgi:CMP-N,N'-diacetyllegionaminic acid synthase